ncbi:hypothetical protein FRB90_012620, partial [Tulasnella sp. 427]
RDGLQVIGRSLKGKVTTKSSWSDLPENVLCQVANLLFLPTYNWWITHPIAAWREWSAGKQPLIWATLLAVHEIDAMRLVCANWQRAMETYQFYNYACSLLDPLCHDAQYYPSVPRAPQVGSAPVASRRPRIPTQRTYTNFARTLSHCCLPCRFSTPMDSRGVNLATTTMWSRYFYDVGVCDRHRPEGVCGVCLKDFWLDSWKFNQAGQPYQDARHRSIVVLEDDEHLRGITATCRTCRSSIVRGLIRNKVPRNASEFTEPILDTFIECGEGYIKDILSEIDEKVWLLTYTNYRELHDSAIAVERMRLKQELMAEREAEGLFEGRASAARLDELLNSGASPEEINNAIQMQTRAAEEEADDDLLDDDYGEVLTAAEEANVSDMAMSGWARHRVMEGLPPPPVIVETAMPLPDRYLDHIPHIPRAPEHMGANTRQLLEGIWRETTAGLFKCQCGICLRASGIAEAREVAKRKAREEEEARELYGRDDDGDVLLNMVPEAKRESAPPPPSPSMEVVGESEVEEEVEVRSSPPLRRSREATEDEDDEKGREVKRQRITPPVSTITEDPRRRKVEEGHELTPMSVDD